MQGDGNIQDRSKQLRILACKPGLSIQTIRMNSLIRCEPLELEYLYTVLKDYDVHLLDGIANGRNPVKLAKRIKADIVLFSSLITTVSSVLNLASKLKKLTNPPLIFVGGPDAEVVPEHFYHPCIDGVFFSNQLEAVKETVKRIEQNKSFTDVAGGAFNINGEFKKNPSPGTDPKKVPIPERYLLHKTPGKYKIIYYKPCASIKTSFGCKGKCTFCFCTEMNNGAYGERPIKNVLDEIETIQVKHIIILDDNFFSSKKRMIEFCDQLEKRDLHKKFIVIGNARFIAQNPDIMKRLQHIGVQAVMVGFEFASNKELEKVNKDASLQDNNMCIDVCQGLDIDLFALFIIDPDWHHRDFKRLSQYIRTHYIPFALYSTLTVFPGTQLARQAPELINSSTKWWRYDLLRAHKKPAHMSYAMFYLWLFYLYMIPGMKFASLRKHQQNYGIHGIIRHAFTSLFMGIEYLTKLIIWK